MNRIGKGIKSAVAILSVVISASLAGCGGGGGGGSGTPPAGEEWGGQMAGKLSGVAATGSPIANATIGFRDASGRTGTVTTGSDGSYSSFDVAGWKSPVLLKITTFGGETLFSIAGLSGTCNIHPFTNLIIRSWFKVNGYDLSQQFDNYGTTLTIAPKKAEIATIKAVVEEVISNYLVAVGIALADFDLITTQFSANQAGFDKVLDGTDVNTSGTMVSITVEPGSSLDTDITTSGGSTTATIDTTDISFAEDITAPSAPSGLSALAVSSSQILLTWSASASEDVIGYKVYQGATEVATVTSTVYIVPGLSASTPYTFTVKAFDAAKNLSGASNEASATTPAAAADSEPPLAPASLTATAVSSTQINLSWSASTDNVGVVGYYVYRDGGTAAIAKVLGATTFSDLGLAAGTTYIYTVKAFDGAGNPSSASNTASVTTSAVADTAAPSAPASLTATAAGSTQINLSWTASTDNVGVVGYYVYRGATKVATVTTTSYSEGGVTPSTQYSYTVKAFDAAGNVSAASNTATATTPATTATLRVKVIEESGMTAVPGATVVLGNSTGAMVAFGITDANGVITFTNPPANATVTAAHSGPVPGYPTKTLYSLRTWYDVNVSAISIGFWDIATTPIGTATVNITNTLGASYYTVYPGHGLDLVPSTQGSVTVNVPTSAIQSDGKVSFVVVGYDQNKNPIGYGTLLDQTFTSGMTVNIDLNQTNFSNITGSMSNIPSTATQWYGVVFSYRNDGDEVGIWGGGPAPIPTSLNPAVVPSFGTTFGYDLEIKMDQNANGMSESWYSSWKESNTLANQAVDFSTFPVIPSNLGMTNAGTARPTLSWSNPAGDYVRVGIDYGTSTTEYEYDIIAPTTRTSIIFPELPASLAAFRPTSMTGFEVVNNEEDILAGYADFLTKYDGWANGTWTLPAEHTDKEAGREYSTTQTLSPGLNKASGIAGGTERNKERKGIW